MKNKLKTITIASSIALVSLFGLSTTYPLISNNYTELKSVRTDEIEVVEEVRDQYPDVVMLEQSMNNVLAVTEETNGQHVYIWGKNDVDASTDENRAKLLGTKELFDTASASVFPVEVHSPNWDGATSKDWTNEEIVDIAISNTNAMIVTEESSSEQHYYMWGNYNHGQMYSTEALVDDASTNNEYQYYAPTEVFYDLPTGTSVKDVELGKNSIYVVVTDGTHDKVYSWGSNHKGQLGLEESQDETIKDFTTPSEIKFGSLTDYVVTDIDITNLRGQGGLTIAMALLDDSGKSYAYTWGADDDNIGYELVGDYSTIPYDITEGGIDQEIVKIDLEFHTGGMLINNNGANELWAWGWNYGGEATVGAEEERVYTPTKSTYFTPENPEYDSIIDFYMGGWSTFVLVDTPEGVKLVATGLNDGGIIDYTLPYGQYYMSPKEALLPFDIDDILAIEYSDTNIFVKVQEGDHTVVYSWGQSDTYKFGHYLGYYDGVPDNQPPTQILFQKEYIKTDEIPEAEKAFPWWIIYLSITLVVILILAYMAFEVHKDHEDKLEHHWFHIGRH